MKKGWIGRLTKNLKDKRTTRAGSGDPADPESANGEDQMQAEMLESVREFPDTQAREVMIPRTDIKAVEQSATQEEAAALVLSSGFSRIPVYRNSIDHITGVIHAKDLLRCCKEGNSDRPLTEIMMEPRFIPETKKVDKLLAEFKTKRVQMAVVLDEYGGTAGLVTLEDLIEEIVGEIEDEYDSEVVTLTEVSPNELLASARVEISDIEDYFDLEIEDGNFTTVGGWISENTGHIPAKGQELEIDGLRLKIEAADERRVLLVRLVRPSGSNDDGPASGPD